METHKVPTHVPRCVRCSAGLFFIWLKLSSSICRGYFLCNLAICCVVIVAHSKLIAKKWQSVRLVNVLAITKCRQWHLPPYPHALPPFFHPPPSLPPPHTSLWSGNLSDEVALERLTSSLCHLCLEMVECPARLTKSCWRLLPPIGDSGITKNEVGRFFGRLSALHESHASGRASRAFVLELNWLTTNFKQLFNNLYLEGQLTARCLSCV